MMKIFIVIAFLIVAASATFPNCDRHIPELAKHSGFYRLPHSRAARMFYFFFNSRARKTDPVVLWLAGGPGCGGATSALNENGPFQVLPNLSLLPNPYGWDKVSNLIYVDQPIGTGFTLSPDANDTRHNEEGIAGDLYDFLQAFYLDHPQYSKNKFYIAGESYAGHNIPPLASKIQKQNRQGKGIHINLKGIAIGNGWTNPLVQYKSYSDYALLMNLIGMEDYERLQNTLVPQCKKFLKQCVSIAGGKACDVADDYCEGILNNITRISGVKDTDIRKKRSEHTESFVGKFMNQSCIKDALGVGRQVSYISCNTALFVPLKRDFFTKYDTEIPAILEDGVEVLIYVGASDLVCNWIGNKRWVLAMKWYGAQQFEDSPTRPFMVNGAKAGEYTSYGPLLFMKVFEAGHIVPTNQPEAALRMLSDWMDGRIT